jgi:hypothetical protein
MSINNYRKIFLYFTYCFFLSAGIGNLGDEAFAEKSDLKSNAPLVVWEPEPRKVGSGNSGQLVIRASESMYLLHAERNAKHKTNVLFSNSHNIGDTFAHSHPVNSESEAVSSHGENGPQLRVGMGIEIYTAWEANRDIKFSRSMSFGRKFLPSLRVNDDKGDHSQSFFTMEVGPRGAIYIAWLDGRDKQSNRPGTSSLYIAKSTDQGATFGKNIKVAGDICPCCRPAIAFGDSGEVFISWRHVYKNHERIIVVASSRDGGKTWGETVKTTATGWKINGCAHAGPSLRFVNGRLVVVWYTAAEGRASVKMAQSLDKGKTFSPARDIQGEVLDPTHPYIAASNDETWVIFQGRDLAIKGGWAPAQSWVTRISASGNQSVPESLPTLGGGVVYPYLFMGNGGRMYAIWTELGDKGPYVVLCRGRIQTGL